MGIGDEESREKMNRGKFAHEFTRIYTNWRLVRPVSPFKTGACLLMGRNFRIVADNITAYLYWKWNNTFRILSAIRFIKKAGDTVYLRL